MKIAVISDIHFGEEPTHKDNKVRSTSHLVPKYIKETFDLVKNQKPELIINHGDLVRAKDLESDKKNYKEVLNHFETFDEKKIHILGNHDVRNLSKEDISSMWKESSYTYDLYGSVQVGEFKVVWISFKNEEIDGGTVAVLEEEELKLLDESIKTDKQVLLFTHYPVTGEDFKGNYLFDGEFVRYGHYYNSKDILDVISKSEKVKAVISAHSHWVNYKVIDGTPHITLPSFSENIAASNAKSPHPMVYTIIDCENDSVTVKCYSDEYCFASLEV